MEKAINVPLLAIVGNNIQKVFIKITKHTTQIAMLDVYSQNKLKTIAFSQIGQLLNKEFKRAFNNFKTFCCCKKKIH